MKKSTLYFTLALTTVFICALHAPIVGNINLKQDGTPADFISSIWSKFNNQKLLIKYPEHISHIKIQGDGNTIVMQIAKADSSYIMKGNMKHLNQKIIDDTLIISTR